MSKKSVGERIADARQEEPATPPAPTVSKMDAVREALAAGKESKEEIVSFAKEKHGLEITPEMATTYKSQIRAKSREAQGQPSTRKGAATPAPTSPTLDDLMAVKRLIDEQKQPLEVVIQAIKDVQALAEKAGGMDRLVRIVEALEMFAIK